MFAKEQYLPEVEEGYVSLVRNQQDPDVILLNYTPLATYGLHWNDITLNCRGLILNEATGEVLARPFPKFFNYGETDHPIPPGKPEITIKQDGSLGICYRLDGELKWATRGSFTSVQSQYAQEIWDSKYKHVQVPDELTLLVEIIHPGTRVVVKYDFTDLVLIGAINRHTGYDYTYAELAALAAQLGLLLTEKVDGDLDTMLAKADTLDYNEEGFVLRWSNGYRLKVKGKEYLEVHRILHGLSTNQKLKFWEEGRIDELIFKVPEEFRPEIEAFAARCDNMEAAITEEATENFAAAPKDDRKTFALWVNTRVKQNQKLVFKLLDQKDITPDVRRLVIQTYKEVYGDA